MPDKFAMIYEPPTKPRRGTFLQVRKLAAVGVLGVAGIVGMHVLYLAADSTANKSYRVDRPNDSSDAPEQVLPETSMPAALSTSSSPTPTIEGGATQSVTPAGNSTDIAVPSKGQETSGRPSPEQRPDKAEKSAFLKQKMARRQHGGNRAYAQNIYQYSYRGNAAVWPSQRSSAFLPF
jgi:hypothetical protein